VFLHSGPAGLEAVSEVSIPKRELGCVDGGDWDVGMGCRDGGSACYDHTGVFILLENVTIIVQL